MFNRLDRIPAFDRHLATA